MADISYNAPVLRIIPGEDCMNDKAVDYLDLIARAAAEDRAERDQESVQTEPVGEQVVDYLAVSEAWKEEKARMKRDQDYN